MMLSSEETGNRGWVFLRVLAVVMAWQLLEFAGGVFAFVSVWPKVAASHEAFGMAGLRDQLMWRHAGVLARAYVPAGMLMALAVYPVVVMWAGRSGRFWSVVWRTLLLVLLVTLLVSAVVVHYRPWMVSGMDGRHWYFRMQEAVPGWVRQGVLPFALKGTVVAWLAFSGGWYCYRFVCWLRSGWTAGACAATASGMVALTGLGLQLAPEAERSDGGELSVRAGGVGGASECAGAGWGVAAGGLCVRGTGGESGGSGAAAAHGAWGAFRSVPDSGQWQCRCVDLAADGSVSAQPWSEA
jgi:hypothetical protein